MTKRKIWIIDDDPIFRLIFIMTLKKTEKAIDVIEFENGKQAIEAFAEAACDHQKFPDYLLVDLNMPTMNGWQFLEALKKVNIPPHCKMPQVFVVSSSMDKDEIEKIKEYPFASDFITKPISLEVMKQILI